jgi:hypothetical protein
MRSVVVLVLSQQARRMFDSEAGSLGAVGKRSAV